MSLGVLVLPRLHFFVCAAGRAGPGYTYLYQPAVKLQMHLLEVPHHQQRQEQQERRQNQLRIVLRLQPLVHVEWLQLQLVLADG